MSPFKGNRYRKYRYNSTYRGEITPVTNLLSAIFTCYTVIPLYLPKKMNISPKKGTISKGNFVLQPLIFRGYICVCFRGSNIPGVITVLWQQPKLHALFFVKGNPSNVNQQHFVTHLRFCRATKWVPFNLYHLERIDGAMPHVLVYYGPLLIHRNLGVAPSTFTTVFHDPWHLQASLVAWMIFWMIFSHHLRNSWADVGVSKNRGTPKWMVYNGKPY